MNANENTTHKTWDTQKAKVRGKFTAFNDYIKKEEQTKPKGSKKNQIVMIRVNINEMENKKE